MPSRETRRVTKLHFNIKEIIGILKDTYEEDLDVRSLPSDGRGVALDVAGGSTLIVVYDRVQVAAADQLKITHDRNVAGQGG